MCLVYISFKVSKHGSEWIWMDQCVSVSPTAAASGGPKDFYGSHRS